MQLKSRIDFYYSFELQSENLTVHFSVANLKH